jgi:hypothetical protein
MNLKKLKFLGVNICAATFIGLFFLFFSEKIQNQVNPTYSVEISSSNIEIQFEPMVTKTIDALQSKVDEITSHCRSEDKVKVNKSRIEPGQISFHLTLKKSYTHEDCLNYIDLVTNDYFDKEVGSEYLVLTNTIKNIKYEDLEAEGRAEKYNQTLNAIKKIDNQKNSKIFLSETVLEQTYPNRLIFNYLSFFVGFLLLFFNRALKKLNLKPFRRPPSINKNI